MQANSPARVRTIEASELKAKCLELMDEAAHSGEEIVITKDGHPASRLVPCNEKPKRPARKGNPDSFFGRNRDSIRIIGDIVGPMPAEWFGDTRTQKEDVTS